MAALSRYPTGAQFANLPAPAQLLGRAKRRSLALQSIKFARLSPFHSYATFVDPAAQADARRAFAEQVHVDAASLPTCRALAPAGHEHTLGLQQPVDYAPLAERARRLEAHRWFPAPPQDAEAYAPFDLRRAATRAEASAQTEAAASGTDAWSALRTAGLCAWASVLLGAVAVTLPQMHGQDRVTSFVPSTFGFGAICHAVGAGVHLLNAGRSAVDARGHLARARFCAAMGRELDGAKDG